MALNGNVTGIENTSSSYKMAKSLAYNGLESYQSKTKPIQTCSFPLLIIAPSIEYSAT